VTLEMYNAAFYSDRDGLGTIIGAELLHNVLNMSLYCFLRDKKARCNVAISTSCGKLNVSSPRCSAS
jgi:hypothetical protein